MKGAAAVPAQRAMLAFGTGGERIPFDPPGSEFPSTRAKGEPNVFPSKKACRG